MKFAALAILLGVLPLFTLGASQTNSSTALFWRRDNSADAKFDKVSLAKVLSRLAAETGWKILVDPGANETVSVQFKNASHAEALRLIFGKLSYALVPQSGGGARLYVYREKMRDATRLVEPDGRPKNWLGRELILSLAPGSKLDVDELAAELGGKVVAKADGLNAYRVEFPDEETAQMARERIAAREDVAYHDNYEFDRPALASTSGPSMESLFPIDPNPVNRGDQITVALVDTPIQPLDGKAGQFILQPIHIKDAPGELSADPTHATSMAYTLLNSMAFAGDDAAKAKLGNVRIQPIDIYGSSSSTTTFEVAQGLHKAINSGAQVINLSLGGTGQSPMVDYLLEQAAKKQILVFASAGNSPTMDFTYPAANPYTIAVTATDWQGNIASYANRGSFVDVKAPGTSRINYRGQAYISTGTSTATAYMSGQAAAYSAMGMNASQTTSFIMQRYGMNSAASRSLGR